MSVSCKAVDAVDTPPVPWPVDALDIMAAVATNARMVL